MKEEQVIRRKANKSERGATLIEFAIAATVFLTILFAVIEFGRLYWTHNALRDAARRGTRNANPATATPVAPGLTTSNVNVQYQNYNGILLSSRATVTITGYQFQFYIPMLGAAITMPSYRTSLPGESAGFVPCDIPSGTPSAPCNIIPL